MPPSTGLVHMYFRCMHTTMKFCQHTDVFFFLSFGCRVETLCARYKQRANVNTYTMLYYISVLLVSVVWILSICHFSTVFPEIFDGKLKKQYLHQISSLDVFYFLSFGYRVETVRTHYKQRTNIKTYTTLYYISVLLVSLVWILSICHFPTAFPEIWWTIFINTCDCFTWAYINFDLVV